MKKILTAINNPKLNEELKKEEFLEVICKDIQYKEAILEILEEKKQIDIIILNEKLPGEIDLFNLIKKIKTKNEKIKIIMILENKNIEKENKLKNLNINNIYYNNEININKLIKIINEKEINREEELKKELEKLKKIIIKNEKINNFKKIIKKNKKEKQLEKNKLNNKKEKIKNKILNKIDNKILFKLKNKKNKNKKIIAITGLNKSGKTYFTLKLTKFLLKKQNKIAILDLGYEKNIKNKIIENKKNNKLIKLLNYKNLKNKTEKNKNNINKKYIILKIKKEKIKIPYLEINKKINLFSEINIILKNKKINKFSQKILIQNLLEYLKNNFNFTIIDLGNFHDIKLNKEILINSSYILITILPENLENLKNTNKIIEKYINLYKINCEKIKIIINKNSSLKNINKKIIENLFNKVEILSNIKKL